MNLTLNGHLRRSYCCELWVVLHNQAKSHMVKRARLLPLSVLRWGYCGGVLVHCSHVSWWTKITKIPNVKFSQIFMCVPVNSYQFKFFLFLTESSPVICQNLIKIFSNVDMTLITPLSSVSIAIATHRYCISRVLQPERQSCAVGMVLLHRWPHN